jgi:hypothetical protein
MTTAAAQSAFVRCWRRRNPRPGWVGDPRVMSDRERATTPFPIGSRQEGCAPGSWRVRLASWSRGSTCDSRYVVAEIGSAPETPEGSNRAPAASAAGSEVTSQETGAQAGVEQESEFDFRRPSPTSTRGVSGRPKTIRGLRGSSGIRFEGCA